MAGREGGTAESLRARRRFIFTSQGSLPCSYTSMCLGLDQKTGRRNLGRPSTQTSFRRPSCSIPACTCSQIRRLRLVLRSSFPGRSYNQSRGCRSNHCSRTPAAACCHRRTMRSCTQTPGSPCNTRRHKCSPMQNTLDLDSMYSARDRLRTSSPESPSSHRSLPRSKICHPPCIRKEQVCVCSLLLVLSCLSLPCNRRMSIP